MARRPATAGRLHFRVGRIPNEADLLKFRRPVRQGRVGGSASSQMGPVAALCDNWPLAGLQ
jgi:hypothetical protein